MKPATPPALVDVGGHRRIADVVATCEGDLPCACSRAADPPSLSLAVRITAEVP